MNKVILYGNCGKDPEVKRLKSGNVVAKFSLATNKSYNNAAGEKITETAWHNIVLWGKLAELSEKYVQKGNSLIIEGEIVYRSYENKEKQTVYITEIVGNALHFAGSKKEESKPEPVKEENWQGKKQVKSMSDINDLPGNINDGSIPDDNEMPF
jgi:single-strand DNA-binding protein